MTVRNSLRALALASTFCAALLVPGCSIGFTNLHPGENLALYQHLFDDVISNYDEPYWLWVRGTITGDLNGNGVVDEEVVLATIQQGDARNPGPIEMAFLVACTVGEDGTRTAMARQLLFDSSPIPGSPKPVNDLGIVVDRPFTRCRAQMVQDKVSFTETVVVYFWADPTPSSVWYAGFKLEESGWVKNMETTMWQRTPGFLTANLDRSAEASPYGYQLVFGVAAIPDAIFDKIGQPSEAPLWGHVFARNAQGYYEQADDRYGDEYKRLQRQWNQVYLKASLKNLPPEEMAWFEYHMGLLNHYTGESEMAEAFLRNAWNHAGNPALRHAVGEAFKLAEVDGAEGQVYGDEDDLVRDSEP